MLELVFGEVLLGRAHQLAQRAHERQRADVQRLDLGEHALENLAQSRAVGRVEIELAGELREGVADRRQPRGIEAPDLLAEGVEL